MIFPLKSCLISSLAEEKFVHLTQTDNTVIPENTLKFSVNTFKQQSYNILYLSNLNVKTAAQDFTET